MTDLNPQEREALEAAYKAWDEKFPALTLYDDNDVFEAGYRAALSTVRERERAQYELGFNRAMASAQVATEDALANLAHEDAGREHA